MNIGYLESQIHTAWAGRTIYHYEEIDSTNTQAKRLTEKGAPSGTLVIAQHQTQGKGRRGRIWESDRESSIYMSLLIKPEIPLECASMVTLVMGLSVVQAVKTVWHVQTGIKWPNDVVWNKKKLCGILTELHMKSPNAWYLVVGVGINVNNKTFPTQLQDKATSAYMELGQEMEREPLIGEIMKRFEENYTCFEASKDLSGLRKEYEQSLLNLHQPVRVLEPNHEYTGIALGISDAGELLVEREDGSRQAVFAGEVSVRGLYSYT